MKVLVTGATSLIGKHVVNLLLARGDQVSVLQRRPSALVGVEEWCCDLSATPASVSGNGVQSTGETLLAAMRDKDAVVHLAAKVGVSGRWEDYRAINVEGTRRVIEAAVDCQVPRFVHVSSPSVAHAGKSIVGGAAGAADPDHVRGHYARSKALGEQIALSANGDIMQVASLRPHLVWGPGDTQLVQRIVDKARSGRLLLVGNGQAFIDTTYISNAADAIVSAIDRMQFVSGHALVISNGQPRTVSEIIYRILDAAGLSAVQLRHVPGPLAIIAGAMIERLWDLLNKQEDPPMTRFLAEQLATAHWFDQRETQRLLNWQPAIRIDDGFGRLASSFKNSEPGSDT